MRLRQLLSGFLAFLILFPQVSLADESLRLGDVYDIPVMYLSHGIDETQTTNLTTVAVLRNNESVAIPAMSGAIVELSRGGNTETVYASRVAVNSSTYVVTLTGTIIRDLSFTQARSLVTGGNGLSWQKGTEVRLVTSGKRYNRLVDRTRPATLTASGSIAFSGSGSLAIPTFATTAERDRQLGATPGGPVRTACVTGDACYYYLGGAWIKYGSGASISASTTVRGGVEILTQANLSGGVLTDNTGAPLVPDAGMIIRTSSGAINNRNKVVATDNTGRLHPGLLGTPTGTNSGTMVLRQNRTFGAISASGANLGGTTCVAGDTNFSSTTYAVPDAGLAQTLSPNVGSLILMKVVYGMFRNESGNVNRIFNFQLGNGFARSNASGTYLEYQDGTVNHLKPVEHSWWTTSATGGSLTVQPVLKVSTAGSFTIDGPMCFQTIVVK